MQRNQEEGKKCVMDDSISRQAAIDAIKEYITDPNQAISEYEDNVFYYNSGLKSAVQAIVDLPSTQSKQSVTEWQKDFREYINTLNIPNDDYEGIMEYINEVPSAETEPVKHGKWEVETDCEGKTRRCICNQCGYKTVWYTWKNPAYCEGCGAEMD